MTFHPHQSSRLESDKGTATLIGAEPNPLTEYFTDPYRPAAHLLVGADAERQRQRTGARLLAGTNPAEWDWPQDKDTPLHSLSALSPQGEQFGGIDTDRLDRLIRQR
jgi:hypothetical protein